MTLTLDIVDDVAGIDRIETEWASFLSGRAEGHTVHHHPSIFRAFLATEQGRSTPLVLVVRDADDGDSICALGCFFVWRGAFELTASVVTLFSLPSRTLKLVGDRIVFARDADATACALRIVRALSTLGEHYDLIHLAELALPNPLASAIDRAPAGLREVVVRKRREHVYEHTMFEDRAGYDRWLGSKRRNTIKRNTRRWRDNEAKSRGCLRVVRDVADAPRFATAVARVRRETWQAKTYGIDEATLGPDYVRFLEAFASRGWLRSYLMERHDGTPVAFIIGFQGYDTYHYVDIGFDAAHRKDHPGVAATYLMMEDLYEHDPPARVDFGYGDNRYKRAVCNTTYVSRPMHLTGRRRWRAAFGAQRFLDDAARRARALVARAGLEDRVRDILKHRS
ncbi:MAG: GNAT family N-acetyltransferase [Myxococcota bacterium]